MQAMSSASAFQPAGQCIFQPRLSLADFAYVGRIDIVRLGSRRITAPRLVPNTLGHQVVGHGNDVTPLGDQSLISLSVPGVGAY